MFQSLRDTITVILIELRDSLSIGPDRLNNYVYLQNTADQTITFYQDGDGDVFEEFGRSFSKASPPQN